MGSRTLDYLFGEPGGWLSEPWWSGLVAAAVAGLVGGVVSVPVVLRRVAFVGQGISHAAFAGVGLAAVLGLAGGTGWDPTAQRGLVLAVAVASALAMSRLAGLAGTGSERTDASIGVVLGVTMGAGMVMLRSARAPGALVESALFGDVLVTMWPDAMITSTLGLASLVALATMRRRLVASTFDPEWAGAAGLSATRLRDGLMVSLAVAVVSAMGVMGAALLSALVILPGAGALRVCRRVRGVVALAAALGVVGVVSGVVLSFELNWPPGPSAVLTLAACWAGCVAVGRARGGA